MSFQIPFSIQIQAYPLGNFVKNLLLSITMLTFMAIAQGHSTQTILYVDANVSGGLADGSSWSNALTSLSDALEKSRECDIDSVLVAQGIYIPTDSLGIIPAISQNVSFTLPDTLILLGGFSPADGITTLADRDWAAYPTTLSGDINGDDNLTYSSIFELQEDPDRADNAYHIINQANNPTDSATVIDGFVFVGGNANGELEEGSSASSGGAVYLKDSHPSISNCRFTYNTAAAFGGAIFLYEGATLRGEHLTFSNNYAELLGGAIASSGQVKLDQCYFNQNNSDFGGSIGSGPDLELEAETTIPSVRNSQNKNNMAVEDFPFSLHISRSTFLSDAAFSSGGSILAFTTDLIIDNTSFSNNASFQGGAITAMASSYNGINNNFDSNQSYIDGGAVSFINDELAINEFFGGCSSPTIRGVETKKKSSVNYKMATMPEYPFDINVNINGSTFENNTTAGGGGAIASAGDSITVVSCEFINNSTTLAFSFASLTGGGAIFLRSTYASIDSSEFEENRSENGGSILSIPFVACDGSPSMPAARKNNKALPLASILTNRLLIENSTFSRDSAFFGGSVAAIEYQVDIVNSKFIDNYAFALGGAIVLADCGYYGIDNLYDGNEAGEIGGAIYTMSEDMGTSTPTVKSATPKMKSWINNYKVRRQKSLTSVAVIATKISNGTFSNNGAAQAGGAVYWIGDTITIFSTTFNNNSTLREDDGELGSGGALYLSGLSASIDSSTFAGNVSGQGGSILAEGEEDCSDCSAMSVTPKGNNKARRSSDILPNKLLIENSTFNGDSSLLGGSVSTYLYQADIYNSVFKKNYADEYGGAVEFVDSRFLGTNNLYIGNTAGISGGALSTELALFSSAPLAKSKNGQRRSHRAGVKGERRKSLGEGFDVGVTKIINGTFTKNKAQEAGGAIDLYDTQDTIINCIIWDNEVLDGASANDDGILHTIDFFENDPAYVKNTLLQSSAGTGTDWLISSVQDGGGNIDQDPLYVNAAVDDYTLDVCSPAIDAGDDSIAPLVGMLDLLGTDRSQKAAIDMGAYESKTGGFKTKIYVDSAAVSGDNDGSSWKDAFLELYDGMNAMCLEVGDTILVARGTYLPDTSGLSDYRTASFPLRDSMVIIGGFNPSIGLDSIGEQLPFIQKSIMSGDIGVINDSLDNCYHIINNMGITLTSGTLIDGMHISYGTANGASHPNNKGAGMLNDSDSFDLANCTFEFNTTSGSGGAMSNSGGKINITNCRFNDNVSLQGAGALNNGAANIRVIKTSFVRNQGRFGGAFHNNSGSLKLSDSYFDQNESEFAGAAIYTAGSIDTVIQCVFTRGSSRTGGSAIKGTNTNIAVNNNTFFDNLNTSTSLGSTASAVNLSGSSSGSITNNIIHGNKIGVANSTTSLRRNLSLSINDHALVTVSNNIVGNLYASSPSYPTFFGTDGGGNIDADPQFLDTLNYDLRIGCNSPAIDTGTDSLSTLCLTPVDFIDSTRVLGKRIDIGAYELQEGCQTIEVPDIAFGEVCDTTTMRIFIKNENIGDLVIDTIVSASNTFSYIQSDFSFPYTIDFCDSLEVDVRYNATTSGASTGSVVVTSNAINGPSTTINLTGTLDITKPSISCSDSTVYLDASGMATIDTSFFINSLSDNCGIDTVYLSRTTLNCSDINSPVVITISARDIHGNIQTCTPSISVLDTISPTLLTQGVTLYVDSDGNATLDTSMTITSLSDNCSIDTVYLSQTSFDCDDISAPINVTTSAKDDSGNTSTSVSVINVRDTISPVMVTQNIAVYLDAIGSVSITPSNIDNGSSDNCETPTLSLDISTFGCSNVGTNPVILTGKDASENSSSLAAVVTVIDTISPIAICKPITNYLDENGNATITSTMINNASTDACGIDTLIASKIEFSCADLGGNTVTLTVIDNNNNSTTCTSVVTVQDTISPILTSQGATLYVDSDGNATLDTSMTITSLSDNCNIDTVYLSQTSFDCDDITSPTNVTTTAQDGKGNTATSVSIINVRDTISPVLVTQNIAVYLDAMGSTSITPSDIDNGSNDNCGTPVLSLNISTFECSNVGTNPVILTGKDASENTSTHPAVVTVIDTISPIAICKPITIYLDENGDAILTATMIDNGSNDACGIDTLIASVIMFSCDNTGANPVTLSVLDNNGNSNTCFSTITVLDTIAPILMCTDTILYLNASGSATLDTSTTITTLSDNCEIATVIQNKTSFDCTNLNSTTQVTTTATDMSNNVSTCISIITVRDTISPVMICRSILMYLSNTGEATITPADIDNGSTDNCNSLDLSLDIKAFDCNDIGTNPVIVSGEDASENKSTCLVTVTVIDTISPIAICKPITIYLDENGDANLTATMIDNGSNDACGIDTLIASETMFDCDNVGANPITLSVLDNNGNRSICNLSVTVTDTISPLAICESGTFYLNENGTILLTPADIDNGSTDACGIATMQLGKNTFSCNDLGANPVTITITDNNGNSSTCDATITILDTIAAIVTCENIDLYLDAAGTVSLTPNDILQDTIDNCSGISLSIDVNTLVCPAGVQVVKLFATDGSGNIASCTAQVTVIDTITPIVICKDIILYLDANGEVTLQPIDLESTATDACGIVSRDISQSSFSCNDIGITDVIYTVTDVSGNESMCISKVTVRDTVSPIANCKNLTLTLRLDGTIEITPEGINNGSSDACGLSTITLNRTTFSCDDEGPNLEMLTVTDPSGNKASCESTVTILQPSSPITSAISGPSIVCDNLDDLAYSVPKLVGLTYQWSYSGAGVAIKKNGEAEILIDVAGVTAGVLIVNRITECGDIIGTSTLNINLGSPKLCGLADCLRDIIFVDNELLGLANSLDIYKASKSIQSQVTINAPRSITFKAGESIDLYPPFEVKKGAVFIAAIEQCVE